MMRRKRIGEGDYSIKILTYEILLRRVLPVIALCTGFPFGKKTRRNYLSRR